MDFLSDFSSYIIGHKQFLFNALITALLAFLLGLFYEKFGTAIANRRSFSRNFMLLALTTMLIIYIVKSSVALSLGLVGALSIVRFRTAIKDPEELVYLFLTIGLGLGMGANQATITIFAYILIMTLLFIQAMLLRSKSIRAPESMFVNISTAELSVEQINTVLSKHFKLVELKRMDQHKGKLDLSYIIESQDIDAVVAVKNDLASLSEELNFSFIEQRNLIV